MWHQRCKKKKKVCFTFSWCTCVRLSATLALIKPSYRWNTTFSFIFLSVLFSIGLDAISEANQTNLSFSVQEHLTWYTQRLCKHLGATQERVTDSDLKQQVEAQDPLGCLLPLYFLTPPFWFKWNYTPSSLTRKGFGRPKIRCLTPCWLWQDSQAVLTSARSEVSQEINVQERQRSLADFIFFPPRHFIGQAFFCGKQVSLYL